MRSLKLAQFTAAAAALLGTLAIGTSALAAPGDLDGEFGRQGVVHVASQVGQHIAAAPDDSVIAASSDEVQHVLSDGEIDPTFAADGRWKLPGPGQINDLAVDSLGRVVVAVAPADGPSDLIYRLTPGGQPDSSFGVGGVVDTGMRSPDTTSGFLALDASDGLGFVDKSGSLLRLTSTGHPDLAFGVDGAVNAPAGERFLSLAIRPDGRVLAGLTSGLSQYLPTGNIDPSFSLGLSAIGAFDVALRSDGSAFVQFGFCPTDPRAKCNGKLVLVDGSGATSPGFPSSIEINPTDERHGLQVNVYGEALAVGAGAVGYYPSLAHSVAVFDVLASGALNEAFGVGGVARALPDRCTAIGSDLDLDSQGRPIVGVSGCRTGLVLRFRTGSSGQSDADADGVPDRRDSCRLVAARNQLGCPNVHVKVKLERLNSHGASGRLEPRGVCGSGRKVQLIAGHHAVARVRAAHSGSWRIRRHLHADRYRASVGRTFRPLVEGVRGARVRCSKADSRGRSLR